MNEHERRAEATQLVQDAYAGGRGNIEHVTDELFKMSTADRLDVIKKMEAIDRKCHQDPELAKLMAQDGKQLPRLVIVDRESPNGVQLEVKTVTPVNHDKAHQQSH